MKDTLLKLRSLLSMKSHLLDQATKDKEFAETLVQALRGDLEHAVNLILRKDEQIQILQDANYKLMARGWEQQDKDEAWLADYLAQEDELEHQDEVIAARDLSKQRGVPVDEAFIGDPEHPTNDDDMFDECPF